MAGLAVKLLGYPDDVAGLGIPGRLATLFKETKPWQKNA